MTVNAPRFSKRLAALVCLLLVLLVGTAGAAGNKGPAVRFVVLPQRVVQGDELTIGVAVRPAGVRCSLAVRYADGAAQPGLQPVRAVRGRAVWKWKVAQTVQSGRAVVTVSCARVGRLSRTLVVVGAQVAPKITVLNKGFSIRPNPTVGAMASYGVMLANDSPQVDALNVYVLVNFVMASNVLIGSATTTVPAIGAGSTYALGGLVSFPGAAPVDHLEVVVKVESHAPHSLHAPPLENIRLLPSTYELGWLGSAEGELLNNDPVLELRSAQLSAVVFDAAGNVIGGGLGSATATLPAGTRQFFQVTSGLRAIPMDKAASVQISVIPTWVQPGS